MWQKIKRLFTPVMKRIQLAAKKTWAILQRRVPGLFLATVAIDAALLASHNAVIVAGALSGIAACLSVAFLLFGFAPETRKKVVRFLARYGNYLDMVLTAVLTLIGFKVSVTMGLTALFIGVNLSGSLALIRFLNTWFP